VDEAGLKPAAAAAVQQQPAATTAAQEKPAAAAAQEQPVVELTHDAKPKTAAVYGAYGGYGGYHGHPYGGGGGWGGYSQPHSYGYTGGPWGGYPHEHWEHAMPPAVAFGPPMVSAAGFGLGPPGVWAPRPFGWRRLLGLGGAA
jgi:hypothetical protein